jgi:peptidoglycan/xylan/chitin deacetylase (PgdA/CDA1 family)
MADKRVPHGAVAVTFDDGYKDIIRNALPIIEELEIPLTIFLISDCIGSYKMPWYDSLFFYFREEGRLNELYPFQENLKKLHNEERIKAIAGCIPKSKKDLMLNSEEVKALSRCRHIEIGAHTQTHPILIQMENSAAQGEIIGSKKDIESIVNRPVFGFSYPSGEYNEEIKKLVAASGFTYACRTGGRFNTPDADLYSLARIAVTNSPIFVFAAELCGVLPWLRRVFRAK